MASVLILGGTGFIGSSLVQYLSENNLASRIRVGDKVPPAMRPFTPALKEIFNKVDFHQVNLCIPAKTESLFADGPWDFVFNLAAETKYGQTSKVYDEYVRDLALTVAKAAAKAGVKRLIEVSTAQVYDSGKSKEPNKENGTLKPWTGIAEAKLTAEKGLPAIENLNYVILRPAIVYGPGDVAGITPRIIVGRVYKKLDEKMKLLWEDSLKMNTVHINDMVRALWWVTDHGDKGEVYNVVDDNNTTQESVNDLLAAMYGIKAGCLGTIATQALQAVAGLKGIAQGANEKHLTPWSELCREQKIDPILSPYLDEELLYHNALFVDGSKLKGTGFTYTKPKMTKEDLQAVITHFQGLNLFPKN